MAENKNETKQVYLKEGQVPPKLNVAGEIVPDAIRGIVPQSLPKIPLDQVAQSSQVSGQASNTPDSAQSTSFEKK